MSVEERLLRYCKIDTQSDPSSDTTPSTEKQFNLGKLLVEELKELGLKDAVIDEHCYVYAHLESNVEKPCKTVGFIAHMDTATEYSGENVNPRVIRNYDGKDIELCEGVITEVKDYPQLKELVGHDLIVTDGSTLLGADDKAGIAAIMDMVEYFVTHPEEKHGRIAIGFTPDEEIGGGTKFFNYDYFDADFAYTLDGESPATYTDETFNAAKVVAKFHGLSIHPGSAKDRMINACNLAMEFHEKFPSYMRPEHTEGREGFIHLTNMTGYTDFAQLDYIVRDHNNDKLEEKIALMNRSKDWINQFYGEGTCELECSITYRNMKEIIDEHPEVSKMALDSIKELGLTPETEPARGGTDGAQLSFNGLPCPNLGAGMGNVHGRYEYCSIQQMEQASKLIRLIIGKTLEE